MRIHLAWDSVFYDESFLNKILFIMLSDICYIFKQHVAKKKITIYDFAEYNIVINVLGQLILSCRDAF